MNDERDDRPQRDRGVSGAYRAFATERAPATLNERVLKQASRAAGRAHPRRVGRLRPLAWVATAGLTLAIVVELTGVPEPEADADAHSGQSAIPEAASRPQRTAGEPPVDASGSGDNAGNGRPAAPAARARQAEEAAPAGSSPFRVDNAPLLEQAADIAATRAGPESGENRALRAAAPERTADAPACADEARASADTWYRCIETLRADGHDEAAERELAELSEKFPDYGPAATRPR